MPSSTLPQRTPLAILKDRANVCATVARLKFKMWLECHRKLFLLRQCARYDFFAKNSLQLNALILKDMRCKPLRECLQEVTKMQRELKKLEKQVKDSVKKEKEYNAQFWALARTMRQ